MSRYIDADALKEKIDSMWNGRPLSFLGARILVMIDQAPSIDIVRCKECKKCVPTFIPIYAGDNPSYKQDYCTKWNRHTTADDFCSYGEREGE